MLEAALAPAKRGQGPHLQAGREMVQRRPADEERPDLEAAAHRQGRQMALEFPLPPMAHHLGQRNLHRADRLAAAAEGGGVGQVPGLLHADQAGGQDRADRPRIDPSMGSLH